MRKLAEKNGEEVEGDADHILAYKYVYINREESKKKEIVFGSSATNKENKGSASNKLKTIINSNSRFRISYYLKLRNAVKNKENFESMRKLNYQRIKNNHANESLIGHRDRESLQKILKNPYK